MSYDVLNLLFMYRAGKGVFSSSAPDQLPFAESTSFPEGLSSEAEEKEKTEMM